MAQTTVERMSLGGSNTSLYPINIKVYHPGDPDYPPGSPAFPNVIPPGDQWEILMESSHWVGYKNRSDGMGGYVSDENGLSVSLDDWHAGEGHITIGNDGNVPCDSVFLKSFQHWDVDSGTGIITRYLYPGFFARDGSNPFYRNYPPIVVSTGFTIPVTTATCQAGQQVAYATNITAPQGIYGNNRIFLFAGPQPVVDSLPLSANYNGTNGISGVGDAGGGIIVFTDIETPPGTYTFYASSYSTPIDQGSRTILRDDAIFQPNNIELTLTVTAPPAPPPIVPTPRSSTTIVMSNGMGLPTGGGSPRLYGILSKAHQEETATPTVTAVRFVRSDDFGETFRPGLDIGAVDGNNIPITDGYSAGALSTRMNVFPSGTIYVYGNTSASGGSPTWKSPRISKDGGNSWRDTVMVTGTMSGTTNLVPGTMPWFTRGGDHGAKGSGNKSGGAYNLYMVGRDSSVPHKPLLISTDDGDTWEVVTPRIDAAGPEGYAGIAYGSQPQSINGYSWNNSGWSEDDFITAAKFHHVNPLGFVPDARIADEGVVIVTSYNGGGYSDKQLALAISRFPFIETGIFPWTLSPQTEVKRCYLSPTKDGLNLIPILGLGGINGMCIWAWKNFIVIMQPDPYDGSMAQVYKSDNSGKWYRKTCHTTNAGISWVQD
jgi:hypothetical protein